MEIKIGGKMNDTKLLTILGCILFALGGFLFLFAEEMNATYYSFLSVLIIIISVLVIMDLK